MEDWRGRLGRYGITGNQQTRKIGTMSDGQCTQLVFCWLGHQNPHMLLFDEPTNHLVRQLRHHFRDRFSPILSPQPTPHCLYTVVSLLAMLSGS